MQDIFLIKKILSTEKAVRAKEVNQYVFVVKPSANKNEVKKAVKELYKVDVVAVNMLNRRAKTKRFYTTKTAHGGKKIAVVTLKKGQTIKIA